MGKTQFADILGEKFASIVDVAKYIMLKLKHSKDKEIQIIHQESVKAKKEKMDNIWARVRQDSLRTR